MKLVEVLVVLNLCPVAVALGSLNDSRSDLIKRLGMPNTERINQIFGSQECVFGNGVWEIHAFLLNGRCHMISYLKKVEGGGLRDTAVFKTAHWKTLEGRPLGDGNRGSDALASL